MMHPAVIRQLGKIAKDNSEQKSELAQRILSKLHLPGKKLCRVMIEDEVYEVEFLTENDSFLIYSIFVPRQGSYDSYKNLALSMLRVQSMWYLHYRHFILLGHDNEQSTLKSKSEWFGGISVFTLTDLVSLWESYETRLT